MDYKYLVLDFGGVIVTPTTGHWDITPRLLELVDISSIDKSKFREIREKYKDILSEKIETLEEEYDMFYRFYDGILSEIGIPNYSSGLVSEIAYDRTYNSSKYTLCDNVVNELSLLKRKYKLILLSDNWPCVIPYMKEHNLYDFFDKIYVSSVFGVEKKDGVFFEYPIKDFNISDGEALFIDDNEKNLEIASEYGFDCMLMNRNNKDISSNYRVINNLLNILEVKREK